MLSALITRWKSLDTEQIIVSIVLAHIMQLDPSIKRLAFTTEIRTRARLQQELMAYRKRPHSDTQDLVRELKRVKLDIQRK